MIKPAELRKGNLVKHVYPGTTLPGVIVEVLAVKPNGISFLYPNLEHRAEPFEDDLVEVGEGDIPLTELEPISFNEEWLLKAGFTVNDNMAVHSVSRHARFKWHGGELVPAWGNSGDLPIRHVHQLQNAYAAAEGSALQINP